MVSGTFWLVRCDPVIENRAGCPRIMGGSGTHQFSMDTEHSPAGNPWGPEPLLAVGELAADLGVGHARRGRVSVILLRR